MPGTLTVRDVDSIVFQRREWVVERIWWVVLAVLLTATLLGVFSGGVVSETSAGGPDAGVTVKYERFVRNAGKVTWTVHFSSTAVANQTASLHVSDELTEAMVVQQVSPEPSSQVGTDDGIVYEFDARSGSEPEVRLTFRPDTIGPLEGWVSTGEERVPLSMFVYP